MEILNSLEEIFKDIFDDEELKLERETSADDIDDWDSLAQINLIVAIEKEFNVKFSLEEVATLKNVGEMADLIERKLG